MCESALAMAIGISQSCPIVWCRWLMGESERDTKCLVSPRHDMTRAAGKHTHTPADSRRHTKFQSAVRSMDNWLQWNAMSTDCVWALCVCVCAFWRASGADHTTIHKYNRVLSNYMRIVKDDCRPEYAMHSMQAMNTRACSHTLMDHLGNLCLNNF